MSNSRVMPAGFYVDGFRSLVKTYLPLRNLTILVGRNDSGKTSFIEAFNLFQEIIIDEKNKNKLKSGYFTRTRSVIDKDGNPTITLAMFFKRRNIDALDKRSITNYFGYSNNTSNNKIIGIGAVIVSKISYANILKLDFKDTVPVSIKRYLFETEEDKVREKIDKKSKNEVKEKYQKIRELIPNIISFSAQRDLTEEYMTSSGVLNKILAEIIGEVLDKHEDVRKNMDSIRTRIEDELKDKIISNVNRVLSSRYHLDLNIRPVLSKPKLDKAFELDIHVNDEHIESSMPISDKGLGIQNIVYIELLRYVKSNDSKKGVIILIDEPENHLHPKLLHVLYRTMIDLSNSGNNVILITHSPIIINNADYKNIIHVKREGGITHLEPIHNPEYLQKINNELGVELSDILGANVIIFVEGRDDEIFIKRLLQERGVYASYTIISVSGYGNIDKYVEAYLDLMRRYSGNRIIVIADNDCINEVNEKIQRLKDHDKFVTVLSCCDKLNGTLEDLYTEKYFKNCLIGVYVKSSKEFNDGVCRDFDIKKPIRKLLEKCLKSYIEQCENKQDKQKCQELIDKILKNTVEKIVKFIESIEEDTLNSKPRKDIWKRLLDKIKKANGEILRHNFYDVIEECYDDNFDMVLNAIKSQLAINVSYENVNEYGRTLIEKIEKLL